MRFEGLFAALVGTAIFDPALHLHDKGLSSLLHNAGAMRKTSSLRNAPVRSSF
jgi:hypothetical protein